MAKVRFTRDFNYDWPGRKGIVSTSFKGGHTYSVKREWADAIIAMGAAKEVSTASRKASASKATSDAQGTD